MVTQGTIDVDGVRADYKILDSYNIDAGKTVYMAKIKLLDNDEWTFLSRDRGDFSSEEEALSAVKDHLAGIARAG